MRTTVLLLIGAAAANAFTAVPMVSRSPAAITSLSMGQGPPPGKGLAPSKAKLECLEVNKKQWGVDGAAAPAGGAPPPAPKKAAKAAAKVAGDTIGFSGVPSQFARPEDGVYAAESSDQTFLGMAGPRADGHRAAFGTKHAASMLALSALLWQPVSEAGMYKMDASGHLNKESFNSWEIPGFGNAKKVPTIESLFPFSRTGFEASPALFSAKSMIVVEDPRDGCGAYDNKGSCHTFLDEMGDMLKAKQQVMPRSEGKATYSFPWMYEHAVWKK